MGYIIFLRSHKPFKDLLISYIYGAILDRRTVKPKKVGINENSNAKEVIVKAEHSFQRHSGPCDKIDQACNKLCVVYPKQINE